MLRFIAPAGAPVEISEIIRAAGATIFGHRESDEFLQALAARLNARHAFAVVSGRSALALILRSLSRLSPLRRVAALPAYTCFTVAAAVVRAQLSIYPVDIDPETLDYNFENLDRLPSDRLLCLVSSNLFGLANDGAHLRAAARARGAFFVDDAAQAMGASRNGSLAGMMGDVGFYSFGRGKALAAVEGALIVTNSDEIAAAIREEIKKLPFSSVFHSTWLLFQILVYSVFLNPRLYWFPNSLPFLNLGVTEFDPGFPELRMPALVQELLPRLMNKLEELNRIRRENATTLAEALRGSRRFTIPQPGSDCQPSYVRFPVIAQDEATRDQTVGRLRSAGIGASAFYPSAICDIPGIDRYMATADFHCPRAEDLSRRLLTLPIHPFVREGDLRRMIAVLKDVQWDENTLEA
jgi:perosamine synthetase